VPPPAEVTNATRTPHAGQNVIERRDASLPGDSRHFKVALNHARANDGDTQAHANGDLLSGPFLRFPGFSSGNTRALFPAKDATVSKLETRAG